jgi:hypothetical protein
MMAHAGAERTGLGATAVAWMVVLALGAGAAACVMVVFPYRSFDLDRFIAPKELALHAAALVAGVLAITATRRLSLTRADAALIAWLALSALSAFFATNHWLAYRALSLSMSGAAVFWSARFVASAGLGPALARILALVVVLGALTALAQAYGVTLEFATLNRAPGGTYGNRNFMAHLTAAAVPLLLWCIANARGKLGAIFWTAALTACAAALVLSRTRAAWLAIAVSAVIGALVAVLGPALGEEGVVRRRMTKSMVAVVVGVLLALAVPNSLDWRSDSPYLDSMKGVVDFREGSGRGRVAQYVNSATMAVAHPLVGVGPGNWPVIYPRYAPPRDPSLSEATGMASNAWPSSDWVAALSERGVPAFLALAAFVALVLGSALAARYSLARAPGERLAALAGGGVVLIAALEGGFDAVQLLPTPMIVVWGAAGALVAAGAERGAVVPPLGRRLLLATSFAAVTLLACWFSARRIEAMRLAEIGGSSALEAAASTDPGSYRIQLRAADHFLSRGQCGKARTHALEARALFPYASAPRRVLSRCRS